MVFIQIVKSDENLNATTSNNLIKSTEFVSRCPNYTNESGIWLYSDSKLCNIYHECNCTHKLNDLTFICINVKTNVCPSGYVFINSTNKSNFI